MTKRFFQKSEKFFLALESLEFPFETLSGTFGGNPKHDISRKFSADSKYVYDLVLQSAAIAQNWPQRLKLS